MKEPVAEWGEICVDRTLCARGTQPLQVSHAAMLMVNTEKHQSRQMTWKHVGYKLEGRQLNWKADA